MTRKHDFRISTYALLHINLLGMSLESLVPRFKSSIIFHYNSCECCCKEMFQTDDYREVNVLFKSIHEVATVPPLIEC